MAGEGASDVLIRVPEPARTRVRVIWRAKEQAVC